MPKLLRDYLDFQSELESAEQISLPLFHVCTQDEAIKYLTLHKIFEKEVCDVFNKKIIYTFYGASKYRSGKTFNNQSNGQRSVCLILDIDLCEKVFKIYPLDTGLATGKVKGGREYIIPWEIIEKKLDLGQQKNRINKIILHCFESIEKYLDGMPTVKDNKIIAKYQAPATVSHVDDLHKIIKDQSIGDDRRFFVEVLFDEELELMPDLVKGIIASVDLIEDEDFKNLLDKYRISIKEDFLFYPSGLEINNDIDKIIKDKSIEYTKRLLQ